MNIIHFLQVRGFLAAQETFSTFVRNRGVEDEQYLREKKYEKHPALMVISNSIKPKIKSGQLPPEGAARANGVTH